MFSNRWTFFSLSALRRQFRELLSWCRELRFNYHIYLTTISRSNRTLLTALTLVDFYQLVLPIAKKKQTSRTQKNFFSAFCVPTIRGVDKMFVNCENWFVSTMWTNWIFIILQSVFCCPLCSYVCLLCIIILAARLTKYQLITVWSSLFDVGLCSVYELIIIRPNSFSTIPAINK